MTRVGDFPEIPLGPSTLANKLIDLAKIVEDLLDPPGHALGETTAQRRDRIVPMLRKMRVELRDAKDARYARTKNVRDAHLMKEKEEDAREKRAAEARERLLAVLVGDLVADPGHRQRDQRLAGEIKGKRAQKYWRAAIEDIERAYLGLPTETKITAPGHRQQPPQILVRTNKRRMSRFKDERGRGYIDPVMGKIYTHEYGTPRRNKPPPEASVTQLSDDDIELLLNWCAQIHHSVVTTRDTVMRRKLEQERARRMAEQAKKWR